ncbi:serine/threonine-protein phosphatase 2A regulatory subunit B'' subunit alpha [Nematolebias whitei]|uniref:serine/threonine-protein phosphatase 2A regulatory subunit B'' subunit alpha n=1 Tax=Nematolebias whitei TaxID=451745 RepID=UPI001898932D|nr:serine/threonine-protein phosphatase 2A regulatory subunit B'' subunit alpha [Nematolebias whitei]
MAAAYRVVVSSVSCYNSVVVDRRSHSQAVHYCSGPCGVLSQGLDCTVAHRGTCSELLVASDSVYNDFSISPIHSRNMITQQLSKHSKLCVTMDTIHNGCLERTSSSGNLSSGEDSPTWRGKKTPSGAGSTGNMSCSVSLKDITEEAINLASGKLKEFSFDKLRLTSSSHVTFRKGRKVRPDSFSRRSTDLDIIYSHISSNLTTNTTANSMTNGLAPSNDENLPPLVLGKGMGMEEAKLKGSSGMLSANNKAGSGSTSTLSSMGSLNQSLNTVASLYCSTLGEENLIARLLEKTRAEAATGGTGGEDIRACLDILLKCSEDLKKCTDIIKQCIKRKAGGNPEDGGASPDNVYRAVMTRLSSYLKRLPLELEGSGSLGGSGLGGQGAPGSRHSDLAELVNTLHSIQQGPFSPIFGSEQPPRYEDVVQSPPVPKTISQSSTPSLSLSSSVCSKSDFIYTKLIQSSAQFKGPPLTNGLQPSHASSLTQHTLSPPSVTCSSSSSSPTHSPSSLRNSPSPPDTHNPPASPMEALYIEEEADMEKTPYHVLLQTHSPPRGVNTTSNNDETMVEQHLHLSQSNTCHNSSNNLPASSDYISSWAQTASLTVLTPKAISRRNDDIDKLLIDLENLSQSMSHPRITELPLPVKTRKRVGGQGTNINESLTHLKMTPFHIKNPSNHQSVNGLSSNTPLSIPPSQGQNSEHEGAGDEEDGALLLRILESIESFAQELVDSGPGSTGSAERKCGKEREVMRLLQDTLTTAGRAETPESTNSPAVSTVPFKYTDIDPAAKTKYTEENTPVVSLTTTSIPAVPGPDSNVAIESALKPTLDASPDLLSLPKPVLDNVTEASAGESVPEASVPTSFLESTHLDGPSSVVSPEAPASVGIRAAETTKDNAITVDEPATMEYGGTTLLIQQTPEVIRVQSKPEKKPGTPPPLPTTTTPAHTQLLPSPPPSPVIVTPTPPAINIPRFYYPCGLPTLVPGTASADAVIAAIEMAFTEFEEEKSDIYEMGKIAKNYDIGNHELLAVKLALEEWRHWLEDVKPDALSRQFSPPEDTEQEPNILPSSCVVGSLTWSIEKDILEAQKTEPDPGTGVARMLALTKRHFWWPSMNEDIKNYVAACPTCARTSSNRIIERLFSGAVTRGNAVQKEGRMSYAEFVWFLMSEEDKKNPTSIEYWFRCMDVDGDGVLSMYELEYFYEEQCERMESMGIEPLPFQDLLCQMLDLVKPESTGKITLSDLKRCRMAHIFFDTFFNLEKYLDHEQRDPFAIQKDIDSESPEPSDWDKYASEEYEILVAEETANDQLHEGTFDDDYEAEELQVPGEISNQMEKLVISKLTA